MNNIQLVIDILKEYENKIPKINKDLIKKVQFAKDLETEIQKIILDLIKDLKTLKMSEDQKYISEQLIIALDDVVTKYFCRGFNCVPPVQTGITFQDVVGMDREKNEIISQFQNPILYPKLFPVSKNNILLYGPPGTGKTYLVKALINQIKNYVLFSPDPSQLKNKYVGDTEKLIKNIFDCACEFLRRNDQYKGAVIFLDEIEFIASKREENEDAARSVPQLLQAWDGIVSNDNISIIGATNLPGQLDGAVLRRFNTKIFIDLPNYQSRMELIKMKFKKHFNMDYTEMKKYDIINDSLIESITERTGPHENNRNRIKHRLQEPDKKNSWNTFRNLPDQEISAKAESEYGFSASDINNLVDKILQNSANSALYQNKFYKITDVYRNVPDNLSKYFISVKNDSSNTKKYHIPIISNNTLKGDELNQEQLKNLISFYISTKNINKAFLNYKSSIIVKDYEKMLKEFRLYG